MSDFQSKLEQYAELAVRVGVNIQPGQRLVINASIDAVEFVRVVTKKAYEAGAVLVKVNWSDDQIARMRYDLAPDESFEIGPKWYAAEMEELAVDGGAILHVVSDDPDLLKGVNPERISTYQMTANKALAKYREYVQSEKLSWSIVAVPSEAWAAKVFPDVAKEEQVSAMWDAILKAVRVGNGDAIEAWEKHVELLNTKSKYLNDKAYKQLHYVAPGTDLTIGLPEGHLWAAAESTSERGFTFMANMPTEEVFTAPLKSDVNGYVSSTKPLSYGGNIIDNFKLTFKDGRIVGIEAQQGQDTLERLVSMDEGSHYLGEVALVPHKSPISESNILYYNTLFDENASNHLAIGSAYAFNLIGGKELSRDELNERGLNNSLTHVDFMIGSGEMDIYGITKDGEKEPVFRQGEWAF
ncbi:aminopeptidase [Paenibacillus sp. PsM32]|uniref:Aminopeptidase n=1 Tax=Paenibacillus kyungheensis TaxID=1452732 RepID=A0AAX3LW45_9BACL|nr:MULTISPECIES: aminopeptidase [Paenibacillus]MDN4618268.1 aminopeptidase [Paenibacillus sp. PsM32]MDQ1234289.1 aminopeptidase [Paenibacillus sp. SORGH_AS_0306]MDR6111333.1 aminopeptidase [Paenibacillus sp. SORGH_AS_0338]WCT53902.1 aminopeptidase [Paenibacillus kyungheensis]WDF53085.1 aminopeptidase [Paenibacillus sp. KACC 21273]